MTGWSVLAEVKPHVPSGRKCRMVVMQEGGQRTKRSVRALVRQAFGGAA